MFIKPVCFIADIFFDGDGDGGEFIHTITDRT